MTPLLAPPPSGQAAVPGNLYSSVRLLLPASHSRCLNTFHPPYITAAPLQWAWCATSDIGAVAAAVIKAGPAEWGGKSVGVAGEYATLQQVADTFTRVFGNKVRLAER